MSKRIETLEQLDELLSPDYRFTLGWGSDKNALEKMSWHLIQSLPFDLNIILIGTREWKDDIDREGLYAVEQIDARYGSSFTIDNKELMDWLLSTPLENLAAYVACVVRRQ